MSTPPYTTADFLRHTLSNIFLASCTIYTDQEHFDLHPIQEGNNVYTESETFHTTLKTKKWIFSYPPFQPMTECCHLYRTSQESINLHSHGTRCNPLPTQNPHPQTLCS